MDVDSGGRTQEAGTCVQWWRWILVSASHVISFYTSASNRWQRHYVFRLCTCLSVCLLTRFVMWYLFTLYFYSRDISMKFAADIQHVSVKSWKVSKIGCRRSRSLTPSTPAGPNCCCSKGSAPYWSNPPFLIFDIRALWRSVLSTRAPECQKLKIVG